MKRALFLLFVAAPALAFDPTPEWNVPQEAWMQGLSADQRAAWFAVRRALVAEQEAKELRDQLKAVQQQNVRLANRRECA